MKSVYFLLTSADREEISRPPSEGEGAVAAGDLPDPRP